MELPYPEMFSAKVTEGGDVVLHFSARGFGEATVVLIADDASSLGEEIEVAVRKSDALMADA